MSTAVDVGTPEVRRSKVEFTETCVAAIQTNSNTGRSAKFSALQEALSKMGRLPAEHDFHVDGKAVVKASELLALLASNFDIDPPRVMPQDGEAVVFTWDFGELKRYLTVDPELVDIMDLHKALQMRCVHEIDAADGREVYPDLITLIGARPLSSTTAD